MTVMRAPTRTSTWKVRYLSFPLPCCFFFSGSSLVCLSPDSVLSFRAKQQSIERHFLLYSFFSSFSFCGACETEGGPFFFGVKKIKQRTSLLSNAAKRGVFSLVSFSVSDTQTFFFFIQKRFYRWSECWRVLERVLAPVRVRYACRHWVFPPLCSTLKPISIKSLSSKQRKKKKQQKKSFFLLLFFCVVLCSPSWEASACVIVHVRCPLFFFSFYSLITMYIRCAYVFFFLNVACPGCFFFSYRACFSVAFFFSLLLLFAASARRFSFFFFLTCCALNSRLI